MRNGTLQESMSSYLVELDFHCVALTFICTPSLSTMYASSEDSGETEYVCTLI